MRVCLHRSGYWSGRNIHNCPYSQLAGAQQMAADMEVLQRERDTLAAQLQTFTGRKTFATAFQKEFDESQMHRHHYDVS